MKFEAEKSPKLKSGKFILWIAFCAGFVSWSAGYSQITGHSMNIHGTSTKDIVSFTNDSLYYHNFEFTPQLNPTSPARDNGLGDLLWSNVDESAVAERVALSADGNWLAISYVLNDERLEVRRASDGELAFAYPVNDAYGYIDISHDGSIIAYGAHNDIWLFNREDGNEPFWNFGMGNLITGPMTLTSDGRYLIATGIDPERETNLAWCFEIGVDEPIWTYESEADQGFGWYGISIAEDGNLVVLTQKFTLFVLTLDEGELIWTERTYNSESAVAISDDGSILVIPSLTGRLRVFGRDPDNGEYSELWHYSFRGAQGSWITSCAISPNGEYIAAGTLDFYADRAEGRLALFDSFGNGEPIWIADPAGDEIADIVFNQDGTILAAASWGDFDHEGGDLFIHEVHNREPFYQLVTPGSMAGVTMSADGSRVATSGKAVHNRQFGRGGRVYVVQVDLTGGEITGTVTNADGEPIPNADITAWDNPYTAISDENGDYRLRIELVDEWEEHVISIEARGFTRSILDEVGVWAGDVTPDIDFSLDEVGPAPIEVSATQGVQNRITIQWDPYNADGVTSILPLNKLVKTATGNPISTPSVTHWDKNKPLSPKRDDADDAESINIYRSPVQGGPYRLIGSVEGNLDSYTDMERIFPRVQYYYVVTAEFDNGESVYSEEVIGWVDDNFLIWEADLVSMPEAPELDGEISDDEWEGAVLRDISDVYGYDHPDSAGSVEALIGFSNETKRLYIGVKYYVAEELVNRMGIGVYVDDDADGRWNYAESGSEGNYWGYWIDDEPAMFYRSLSGPPHNGENFYQFDNAELAIAINDGFVNIEMAIPLGFHSTKEVAIYAPDYNIGLAMFAMTRDDDGNPIFEGWWPQDILSIVSNPYQFAQVHLPVDLIVPPQAPEEIYVERDTDDIVIYWTDPELGIDRGDLRDFAGINIYKNGHFTHTADPDESEWIDEAIDEFGWYEYSLKGFVMEGEDQFLGPLSESVGIYGVREPDVSVISQDDSTLETYFIVDSQGEDNRFAVKYNLEEYDDTLGIYWIDFFPNAQNPIDVYLAEDDDGVPGSMIGSRFTAYPSTSVGMYRFHYPGTTQPRIVINPEGETHIWVVLNYLNDSPGTPAIGIDRDSADPASNKYHQAESGWHDLDVGRLMVRLGVGAPPADIPEIEPELLPKVFSVGQNYPNPFNSSTVIPVELPTSSRIKIDVYGIDGRMFNSFDEGEFTAGYHSLPFNSDQMPAGIYYLSVSAGEIENIIKIILIK